MVHLQLPHRHHHAGPHLAVAALPLPRLQVSVYFTDGNLLCDYVSHILPALTWYHYELMVIPPSVHR